MTEPAADKQCAGPESAGRERNMSNELRINIPSEVEAITELLEDAGHEAFIVGGCVRDSLLEAAGADEAGCGEKAGAAGSGAAESDDSGSAPAGSQAGPADWDMCTDATPEEMIALFGGAGLRIADYGAKHGTVAVISGGSAYEVTTYRIDGGYSDARHPDAVTFTRSLEEDLARRDFTVNAMAYNEERGLVDPFGGRGDLARGVIRCVGDPDKRFREDALRIVRAMRFCSKLGFTADEKTRDAAIGNRALLRNISAERIRAEFVKTLTGKGARPALDAFRDVVAEFIPEAAAMFDLDQQNDYHCYDVWQHTLHAVENAADVGIVKIAAFFHDIGKPGCKTVTEDGWGHFYGHEHAGAEIADNVMRRLRFDNRTRETVTELIYNHGIVFQETEKHARRMLNKFGPEKLELLTQLELADVKSQAEFCREERVDRINAFREIAARVIEQQQCFKISDMAVDGRDVLRMGVPQGPEVGRVLKGLFALVADGELANDRDVLLRKAHEMIGDIDG